MKKPLLTVLRQSTKLLNSIIFFTCWSQLHAHANSLFLNKGENVTPVMEVSSSVREKILDAKTEKSKKTAELHDTKSEKRVRFNKINSPTAHISQGMKTINTKVYSNERYYLSDIKEGIIGTDADHPIDQVYDNIFNVSLNEKINSAYQYTLEYDLYGASSYKQVSKVINDELAIGGNNLQKSEGWIHQSEPISVNSIKEGINTIIFTIPDQSKYSYKIRNLQIGVFKKKHNFEVLNEKHNAATISKFIASISDAEKINLESAELAIPKGTLKSSENFSITALRDIDMPVLSPEMVNVTSKNSGYRFLPHGEHFSAPAKVSIGYDRSKIPAGYTEQDIRTYYFNKSEKKWIALEKDSLNSPQNILVSKTTHFTDMVNGILKVPESPETGSYAPNSIKDIKAANPSEGIVSIAPPSANNMGSVATSFPIKLPAGRAGMQPSLSVNYNSEGGNGWMGMGWDLSIPAVTIDTRWGVPTYNSGVETEIYTLGGEQLTFETSPGVFVMPNRTEGFEKARQSDTLFYPRIEGAYNKILRKGTNPKDYVWIVTSKDGTKSYFGGDENGVNENTVLRVKNTNDANANDNIGYWALYKTVDTHGNYVLYTYHKFDYTTNDTQAIGNKGQEMYINKIEYALTSVANPSLKKYTVNFAYDTEQREDVQVNARLGFVQVTSKRLGNIQVLYDNAPVRSYEFKYKKGGFSKSLLESITEKDASGAEFYTNKIEYFETPSSLFGEPQVWKVDNPVTGNGAEYFSDTFTATIMPGVNEIFGGKYSALNSSSSTSKSSSFRLGFWKYSTANTRPTPIVIMPSLLPIFIVGVITEMGRFSIGAAGGFGSSESQTQVSLVDVDGDNLSDIIYKIGNEYYYAKNKNGHFELNNNQKLNIPGVGYSKSRSWNVGLDGNYAVGTGISTGLGFDYSNTTTDSKIYFEDFNSDGLVDVSNNGKVLFSSNPNASTSPNDFVPNFDPNSMLSPAPIKILSQNISVATPSFNASEKKNMLEQNPLHDVVRVWVAPKAGNIKITNQYQQPPQAYPANEDVTGVDGVAVSVQKNNENPIAASIKSINKDDNTVYTNSLDVSVNQGDKIYFRVSSKYDGRYDQINWNPSIEYTGAASQLDSDGRDINIYDSQKDFVVSDKSLYYIPSVNGQTTNISATIYVNGLKPVTSDQIFINIYKNNVIVNTSKLDWNDNAPVNISFPTILNTSDNLTVKIETDSQIDWAALDLNATINYANGTSDTVPIEFGMYNDRTNTYTQYTVMAADVNNLVITKIPTLPTANFTGNMSIKPILCLILLQMQI
ncbi:SpvB/TcaC N-terminal domain-containing protein [Chryseobacterium sp. 2TAF14]|uniref:SpvB/TcaC N-terminal domain-containing protein n=1 Tax=Chryseobacterium sp. 2TAF14 TaxID=3233007 RepID=UPI003F8F40B7